MFKVFNVIPYLRFFLVLSLPMASIIFASDARYLLWTLTGRPTGDELLIRALAAGNRDWATEALERGASPDARDEIGQTALMWAANHGNVELIERLLRAGADPTATSSAGNSALGLAVGSGRYEAMILLMRAGADVNQRLYCDMTPLHLAAACGNARAIESLIASGANMHALDGLGRSTIMPAAPGHGDGHVEAVQPLIAAGVDIEVSDTQGETARIIAATWGSTEMLQTLDNAGTLSAASDDYACIADAAP